MDNLPAVGGRAVFPQREWAERVGHLVARADH